MTRINAYTMYLVSQAVFAFAFSIIVTVDIVYHVEVAHLNPLQLVLVGTVLETATLLFEIPTGVVADVYGRRWSIVVGTFLVGIGFVVEGMWPRFESILVAQVIWGLGYTFTSGATEAWISDEIGEAQAGRAFVRAAQWRRVTDMLGIGISIALAGIALQVPVVLGGLLISGLGLFEAVFMPETALARESGERPAWGKLAGTLRDGARMVRRRPNLSTVFLAIALFGAFSEGFDRLWTPHLMTNFALPALGPLAPVAWFGLIRAGASLLAVAALEVVGRRVNTASPVSTARALYVIGSLIVLGVTAFGIATRTGAALVALIAVIPLRQLYDPIHTAWVNQGLDPRVRATVLSMSSQANAVGQVTGGPILGAVATLLTTRVEMVVAAAVLLPALVLYWRTIQHPIMFFAEKETIL